MEFTREDVFKLAQTAHINLSEEAAEDLTKDLEKMIEFAKELKELDTTGVVLEDKNPTIYNVLRKDEVHPSMAKEELLANAPQEKNGCFFVPQIVE